MTKKDYELIASGFKEALRIIDTIRTDDKTRKAIESGVFQSIRSLSYKLQEENPRFDTNKFEMACMNIWKVI